MLISSIKGITDPETVFGIFRNGDSAALVNGDVCIHQTAGTKGVDVIGSTTVDSLLFAGVVSGPDIAVGASGTFQIYGYHSSVKCVTAGTVGAAAKISGTAKTCTDGGTNDSPLAHIGVILSALSSGRCGLFVRGM